VVGATVVNIFPISVTNVLWNCGATSGSACPSSGSGSINAPVTLAPGGNAVFTATGVVSPAALTMPPHSAIVTVPGNVTDPDPDNNVFTDGGGLGRPADLTISKTVAPAVVVPGLPVTYTITVTNTGSADADGATVLDLFPPTISGVAWTCSGANGATCAQSSGSDNLTLSLPSFPVGGAATITITGVVAADATGDLVNTAQVLPPVGVDDPTFTNNSHDFEHASTAHRSGGDTESPCARICRTNHSVHGHGTKQRSECCCQCAGEQHATGARDGDRLGVCSVERVVLRCSKRQRTRR